MKKKTYHVLCPLLVVALLLSALSFVSAAEKEHTLYRWTASTIHADRAEFASNLVSSSEADVRWNETGVMYTDQGMEQVTLHTFLNEARGSASNGYGLPQSGGTVAENLKIDAYPMASTEGVKAVDLSFLYAYKPKGKALNPATSGLLRVYVSENGMTWSEDWVGVRSAQIVGSGTTKTGETVIYCEIHCEDLMSIDGLTAGDYIRGVRIMPDGETGAAMGTFSLCKMTLTGYESQAAFERAVPVQSAAESTVAINEATGRQFLVDTAKNSTATTELGILLDIAGLLDTVAFQSVEGLLHATGISMAEGVATAATDDVKEIFEYLYDRKMLDPADAAQMLADYESISTTTDIVKDLNTPQQIFRAYAKSKPGDILLQVTQKNGAHVYIITGVESVYLPDRVNLDPNKSTVTYQTLKGEQTATFFQMFVSEEFAPMVLTALTKGEVRGAQVHVYASMIDGVNVSVISNYTIAKCVIEVGDATVTLDRPGTSGLVCTDKKLADAVAALPDGKHEMTVTVTSGLGEPVAYTIEFELRDGKATVLGTVAPDHDAVCRSKAMTDVDKNAWYHEAVDYALANGIMGGYNATTFGPNDTLSRAMVVQVLYNKEGQPAISGKHDFTDVPADQWFNNAVTWGTKNGVMGGYGNGKFGPNDSVTVEQIAVILWNYAGNPAFTGNADSVGTHSGWAANALSWAVENDILAGVPYENVTRAATRAQTAQMLMNYLTAN